LLIALLGLACNGGATSSDAALAEAASSSEAALPDRETLPDGSKAASCASSFGSALTNAFGRLDGTVLAVVTPSDTSCALPNNDHLVLQVTMKGAAYRMVVNVLSNGQDARVRFADLPRPLPAPAWSEGWQTSVALDYPTLGTHSTGGDFTPYAMNDLIKQVSDRITLGAKVSVYATSSGGSYASSAHLVHRNGNQKDGAIVLDPTGSPRFLLFHFADQSF
jgi:hypothetical protein